MEVEKLKEKIQPIADEIAKLDSFTDLPQLTIIILKMIIEGIITYKSVEGLSGKEKRAFLVQAVNAAIRAVPDIKAIPDFIEEVVKETAMNKYVPEMIDKIWEAVVA